MPPRRDQLTSEVGPDGSGSKPGIECTQMPEKSGMDAALCLPLLAGPVVAPPLVRRRASQPPPPVSRQKGNPAAANSCSPPVLIASRRTSRIRLHPLRARLEGVHDACTGRWRVRLAAPPALDHGGRRSCLILLRQDAS